MRSMLMFAALAAVIGFTGCCGAGGGKLGGCKLGNCLAGKAAGSALGARGASAQEDVGLADLILWSPLLLPTPATADAVELPQ